MLRGSTKNPFSSDLRVFVRTFTASAEQMEQWLSLTSASLVMETLSDARWRRDDLKALQFLDVRYAPPPPSSPECVGVWDHMIISLY